MIPKGHVMFITKIYPTQDLAIEEGEALVSEGYMFLGDGQYNKAQVTYHIGYDEELVEMVQKADLKDTRVKKNRKK